MIISKDLLWLEDYIDIAHPLVKNISALKRISSIHGRPNTSNHCYGQLWKYKNNNFKMSLYVNYYVKHKKRYYSTIDILSTFAHELSHVDYWSHTPDHKILEASLLILFMNKLKSTGYISEESEMENIK